MSCDENIHSIDLLNDPVFLRHMETDGLYAVRVHTMYSKLCEPREHFDYAIGYVGAPDVVDFIIPAMHVFEAGDVLDVLPSLVVDRNTLMLLMGAHPSKYLLESSGVYSSPDRGDEPWTRMFAGKASLVKVKEFEWRLTIFDDSPAEYKVWKPNFADFRTNPTKAWIARLV